MINAYNASSGKEQTRSFFAATIPAPGMVADRGLYGAIDPAPEPATAALLVCAMTFGAIKHVRRRGIAKTVEQIQ